MRTRITVLALSLAVGVALAQKPSPQDAGQANMKDQKATTGADTKPAEMKTMTFKGVLVDVSCGSAATASTTSATSAGATSAPTGTEASNTANRSAGDSPQSCPVKADSSQLGMKLNDGRTLRFDLVGNQRAQDELKNNKRWSKDISANKPIHATVSGVVNGDKLVVSSIH